MTRLPQGQAATNPEILAAWAADENKAWLMAMTFDPLLPVILLPRGYLGQRAWKQHRVVLQQAGTLAERIMDTDRRTSGNQ